MAGIVLDQVDKVYSGGVRAVDQLSLDIADGEFMVLVGPSGCGKSTALRMIAGLEDISSGTVSIGDRVVNHLAPKQRDIAMVFQNYALYPHMTVADNIGFHLKISKVPKAERAHRIPNRADITIHKRPRGENALTCGSAPTAYSCWKIVPRLPS